MSTIDVLDASNWDSVACGLTDWSGETVGWVGGAWFSEGRVTFTDCAVSSGKKITGIDFTYSAVQNPDGWAGGGAIAPWLTVKAGVNTIFDSSVVGVATAAFADYDETTTDISEIKFTAVHNWTIYMYAGGGGTGYSDYYLTILSLSMTYTGSSDPPPLWQSYIHTYEVVTA
jgi:hypothetical protein